MRQTRRLFILGLLIALAVSYVGPVRGYQERKAELREQQRHLANLLRERNALRDRVSTRLTPDVVEQRARELGFIAPGERQYRIKGIDPEPDTGGGPRGIGSWFPPVA